MGPMGAVMIKVTLSGMLKIAALVKLSERVSRSSLCQCANFLTAVVFSRGRIISSV